MVKLVILLARYFRDNLGNGLLSLSLSATPLPFSHLNLSLSLSPWPSTKNASTMSFFSSHHHWLWWKDFGKRGTHLAMQGIWGKISIFLTKLKKSSYGVYARASLLGLCKKFLFGMKSLVWSWVILLWCSPNHDFVLGNGFWRSWSCGKVGMWNFDGLGAMNSF